MPRKHCVLLLLAALISPALCAPAYAKGQLQAGPILLQIGPGESASRLRLSNTGDAKLAAQVRIFAWNQENGEDQLSASDLVVASPPIVELPAGAEQIVRIVRLGAPASGSDVSFRLVVDELPMDDSVAQAEVSVRMRYVLPLFLRAEDATEPRLSCGVETGSTLACVNAGGQAAQLGASLLMDDSGRRVRLSNGLFGYVLPGSRRVWTLPKDSATFATKAREVRLETQLNGQPATLPLQQ